MKITSYKHACKVLGRDPEKSRPKVSSMPKRDQVAAIASAMLWTIVQASWSDNPDWKKKGPDWNNGNQEKWRPYFWMDKPGFRFLDSGSTYSRTYAASSGGSRIAFVSREESDYHAKKHLKLFRDMMVIPR